MYDESALASRAATVTEAPNPPSFPKEMYNEVFPTAMEALTALVISMTLFCCLVATVTFKVPITLSFCGKLSLYDWYAGDSLNEVVL